MPTDRQATFASGSPQRGSVMIEALVSIVVTSLAMLASAALAINAAKVNQTGRYRAQAVMLVNDIGERLQANPVAAADGSYALAANAVDPTTQKPQADEAPYTLPNCSANSCTPEQHATAEVFGWRSQVLSALPQASAQLAFTAAAGTTPARYTVTVNWVERTVGHGNSTRTGGGSVGDGEPFAYTATVVLRPR
jgi:type IV pilus assembly protein PilV